MKHILLVISVLIFIGCSSAAKEKTIVNIVFSEDINDYTPIIRDILKTHPEGNLIILFEEGIFKFFPEKANDKYIRISNNDNGNKRIVFNLENMKNIEIRGDNSTFILHGKLVPFFISSCSSVDIKRINIDYDYPFVFEGEVVANNLSDRTFDVKVHPDNPYMIEGDRFLYKGYDWKSDLGENIVFDPKTHSPIYFTANYEHNYMKNRLSAQEISNGIVRFSGIQAKDLPPVGSIYTDKGPHGKNREIPGFIVQNSEDIHLSDINVYKTGAMALIAEKSTNISLDSFNTALQEGSDRMLSSSADATHFINCSGLIRMENCKFESMLDDATNVHGTYMYITDILAGNKFGASFGHYQQEGFDFGNVGDSIVFVDRTNLMTLGKGKIKTIDKVNENYYIITSDIDVSKYDNPENIAIDNISHYANVHINNCSVKYNRARSLLISTSGNVLIENCYFASMMAGIRICGDANYWFESGAVKNVTIKNNTFDNLGIGGHSPQAILQIDPVIPKAERGKGFYHGKIVFENNKINTFDNQVIYALSVDSLVIRNNVFSYSKKYDPIFTDLSVIDVQYCNHLTIRDNDFNNWMPNATISILKCNNIDNDGNNNIRIVENPNKYFYQN